MCFKQSNIVRNESREQLFGTPKTETLIQKKTRRRRENPERRPGGCLILSGFKRLATNEPLKIKAKLKTKMRSLQELCREAVSLLELELPDRFKDETLEIKKEDDFVKIGSFPRLVVRNVGRVPALGQNVTKLDAHECSFRFSDLVSSFVSLKSLAFHKHKTRLEFVPLPSLLESFLLNNCRFDNLPAFFESQNQLQNVGLLNVPLTDSALSSLSTDTLEAVSLDGAYLVNEASLLKVCLGNLFVLCV